MLQPYNIYDLPIFKGQGVEHSTEGYGYIYRVPADREKAKVVDVQFRHKQLRVSVSDLTRAVMPEEEYSDYQETSDDSSNSNE